MTSTVDVDQLYISPLGRVEGDLDLLVTLDKGGTVTKAWTEASMFRGFEMILKDKDPQAGLIVTPRICGICGGSHLYKACYALDVAWKTHVPPEATRVRNIAQACETLQSVPRWFYALFAIDLVNKKYALIPEYDEVVRRFAPFVGTSYEKGVTLSGRPVEIYAIFGGQWPHSSFMIPGGVMCAPTLSDVTRSIAILDAWRKEWMEETFLGCTVERWLENKSWDDVLAWCDENPKQHDSDLALYIRFSLAAGLDKIGAGYGNYLAMGTYLNPERYEHPTIEGRNGALNLRSGIFAEGQDHEFDQALVREDHTHSFFEGSASLHPWEGRTEPVDPESGKRDGKYTWAKAPRYEVPNLGAIPLEAGPLARQVVAGKPGEDWQDVDPLLRNIVGAIGPSVFVRAFARLHETMKLAVSVRTWLDELDLHGSFYTKPVELADGKGFGATEAARGALADWIVLKDGKIENYQVVTPTAWNIGPRDSQEANGPMEQAFTGTHIADVSDPVELGQIARSFDSCLVCTVHAYDASGKKLSEFVVNGMV
ncbi:MAG: nickel-dependent hydrogenase large subunit [Mycobacteriaceae bacterium]